MSVEHELVLNSEGLRAPGHARTWVSARTGSLPSATVHDALLIISELVTNALRHGSPDIVVHLRQDTTYLYLAVSDYGTTMPVLAAELPAVDHTTGRGLLIVAATANEWGVSQSDDQLGKTVWVKIGTVTVAG